MTHLAPRPEKEWITAAEAASEALPGLPASKRHVNRVIADNAIATRKRTGRGGGREFHWTSLPDQARDEWLKRYGEQTSANENLPTAARESEKDLQAEARAIVAAAATRFIAERKLAIGKGLRVFSAAYERPRTIALEPWVKTIIPKVAPHQIRCWLRALKSGEGTKALRDRRGRPEGTGLFDRDLELKNYVIANFAARPHRSAEAIARDIRLDLNREIPTRTLQLFLQRLRANNKALVKALTDPDRARSHHQPAFGSLSRRAEEGGINSLWEIDATPGDVMCVFEGRRMRVKLTAVIDVFTRRARIVVSDQPRAIATMAVLRRAITDFGMPALLKADNGKEFSNRSIDAFLSDLGIAVEWSRPFTPEQKGHIERFFKTILHDLFEDLPGYLGHNVAERRGIENRKSFSHRFGESADLAFQAELSPAQLQARIDVWLRDIYEQRIHDGISETPFARAIAHAGDVKQLGDIRALDRLLLVAPGDGGLRVVAKKGIALFNRHYVHEALGFHMGRKVSVRFDPHDPSRIAVYDASGETFLCAALDPEFIDNADLMALAAKAKANNRSVVRNIRDTVRKVQRLYPVDGAADRRLLAASGGIDLADDAREAMRLAHPPKLVAAQAMDDADRAPEPVAATPEQIESASEMLAEYAQAEAPAVQRMEQCDGYERPAFTNDDQGFWRWAMERRAQGLALDARDASDIEALTHDETFQLQLKIAGQNAAA